jgi:hypothetical protein
MSLFQNSVLNKYLKGLESEKVNEAYERFTSHFHNPTIQENIRNSKEEQYQGEFLIDLFVNVFGYIKNPTPDFNLTTELKNIKGSKKTDGAILKGEKALAVIELKGTNTTDLSKVETQAFGYKNNQPGCNYVITSNFEKLRFYIDNAVDFEEFNLFQLTKERFEILCLCLSSEYLLKDIPKKIKEESLTQEENITKKLYKDYASFRNEIFDAIQNENPEYDKLTLFKKTQKLLDRFLFIFFAEDRLLLPPNSIRSIVNQWTDLKDKYDEYFPLYDRFKKYFGYMNTGHKGHQHDIFAYNGGLFAPDEILDNIKINDDLLYEHTVNLSNYDFESEVSVNILGHIFEHSLNDIDEIQAEIQGVKTDKSKTKRKKDGVFYTPKYITKYIVDNTIGKLCEEKKTELDIQETEYEKERKGRQKATLKKLTKKLEDYRKWLLQITICDPACGSGAFLNQALEFLIAEHQYIDELQAKLFGDAMILSEVENSILENNLFGVDINEESVEIAKLSLWLRTAQKGRKLTSLNKNIKCGNSIIDEPTIAGDKAFNWQNEFSEVFAKGGFDVIIGNPPYLVVKGGRWISGFQYNKEAINYLKENFTTASQQINTYILFLELGIKLSKTDGYISQITPNTFLANEYSQKLREYFLNNSSVIEIFNSGLVFDDASVETAVITYKNIINPELNTNIKLSLFDEGFSLNLKEITNLTDDLKFLINISDKTLPLLKKLNLFERVSNYAKVWRGLTTGNDKKFIATSKLDENHKPLISGSEVERYYHLPNTKFVNYISEELDRPRDERIFLLNEKLISKFVGNRLTFCYDDKQNYVVNTACSTEILDKNINPYFLLSILNSTLINFYFQQVFSDTRSTFPIMKSGNIEALPLKVLDSEFQQPLIEKTKFIVSKSTDFALLIKKTLDLLQAKFDFEKFSKKLQNWHELNFGEFLKELKKKNVQLSLSEEAEWMQYFNEQIQKAKVIKTEIDKTDNEIDKMVYKLYGLTEDEIKIVEEATA